MAILKYTVIKTRKQYDDYCKKLDEFLESDTSTKEQDEEVELLTILIEKWDAEHSPFQDLDPVEIIRSLMKEHGLKGSGMMEILGISKSYLSEVLHYKKGLSKEVIRKLAAHFKMAQEAFNRPYRLKQSVQPASKRAAKKVHVPKKQTVKHSGQKTTAGKRKIQPA